MKKIIISMLIVFSAFTVSIAGQLQLETIGASVGSNIYLTYLSIGVTADAYENKTYKKESATTYVKSVVGQAKLIKGYLQKLIDSGEVEGEDVNFIKEMISVYDLLIGEGNAFVDFVNTGEKQHLSNFHENRKAAWAKIEVLLGLNKKK